MEREHHTSFHHHSRRRRSNSPSRPGRKSRRFILDQAAGLIGALAIVLLGATGCETSAPNHSKSPGAAALSPYTATLLTEGDTLRVAFEGDTNMNTTVMIQLDGTISLPLVGVVKAVSLTPEQLRADLMERYKTLLAVNEITVTVLKSAATVYVSGAVLKPGPIPMNRPLTALEAIMEAGGFAPRARSDNVSITRNEDGQQRHYRVDLKSALRGAESTPFYLKPYDIIHVPEKVFNL